MGTTIGGWYLNNRGVLEYRLLVDGEPTGAVLATISGLTNIINGTGNDEGKILVKKTDENGNTKWEELSGSDIKIEDEATDNTTGKHSATSIKIGSDVLGTAKVVIAGSANYTVGALDFLNQNDRVHLNGTETITYNSTAGTATVTGKLTAGFTVNGLTATYSAATAAGKTQTLATISGLAKGYTVNTTEAEGVSTSTSPTVVLGNTSFNSTTGEVTAGTITLSKVSSLEEPAAGTVSALGTTAIKVVMDKTAAANGLNYYLAFGNKNTEDYAQVAANDEAPYWSLNKTTATYQYYSPTGYTLNTDDGKKATQVIITPAKTTVVATVTGLAADLTTNVTDTTQTVATEVGTGRARVSGEFKPGLTITQALTKPTTTTDEETGTTSTNKGTVTINVTRSVLPTKGTVTVTAGKDFTVTTETETTDANAFYTKEQADEDAKEGTADEDKVVKDQYIWVISGNKAIYEKVDLAYYERTEKIADRSGNLSDNVDKNGNIITRIICTPQGKPTVLATITGLDADYLENEANLTRNSTDTTIGGGVITHIKGINVALEGTPAVMDGKTVKTAAVPGEIMLSKEVLGTTNASLAKSDNYRLSLATETDAADLDDESTAVDLPGFSNYKWNLVGTTATLKGTVTAGYTASDDGKLITYTAAGDNQTLATVAGLKKGTQLDKSETGDTRTIGNYIDSDFTAGVVASTDALSHDDTVGKKYLNRLPITLSKHVMDGKITLNSNFFTLDINKKDVNDSAPSTITDKAASRTYVLEKKELYTASEPDARGRVTYTENDAAKELVGWYGALGSTVTLRQNTPPCYELVTDTYGTTKTINYTAASKTAKLLATVTGLNPSVTEDDISFDTTNHKITIKNANALTTTNVKITNPAGTADDDMYTLAISDEATDISGATLSNTTWTQAANGTVSYKADVTSAGYKLNADANTITYTKATTTTAATLATITGLKTGLLDGENTTPTGVELDPDEGTITLSKSALGTAKVVLSGEANYKLGVDTSVETAPKTAANATDRWVISGTNAIFKKVIPDYYTLTDNTITYTAPVDVKYQKTDESDTATYSTTLAGKAIVYGTIQGLKSGLSVSDEGDAIGYYGEDGTFVEAITFGTDTDAKKITIKDAGVLNGTTVKLDATAIASGYEIYLDTEAGQGAESLADQLKPEADENTLAWSINRGTATYKGSIGAGYANSDGTAINYSAANNNATIATITGLNTTLTSVGVDDLKFGEDDEANVITVTKGMLGTTDAKLTTNIAILGENYKLALDNDVPTETDIASTSKGIWTIDSSNANTTTATYGTWKDTHYTLNEGTQEAPGACDTITYHKAGVAEADKIATVSGLAGNIVTVKDDQINGIDTTTTDTITLSSSVLPTTTGSTVELKNLNNNTYTLALDATEVTSSAIPTPKENAIGYKISKGDYASVTLTQETSAGFVYGDNATYDVNATDKTKLVYKASNPTGDKEIGTLEGLSKDVEVKDGAIAGIVVDPNQNKITLSKEALSNSSVKLVQPENANAYTLALDDVPTFIADPVWKSVSVGRGEPPKFELYIGESTAGYKVEDDNKSITYLGGGEGKKVATITGLKNPTNANVDINTTEKTITISAGALNAQNVSIDNESGYEYKLALNNTPVADGDPKPDGYVEASESTNTWDLTNGTATFTQAVTAGYALDETTGKIVYTASSSIVSTFTNFSKEATILDQDDANTLAISQDGTTYKGITFAAGDSGKGTFTISDANLLAHKNVKLTTRATGTTADYTIELGTGVAAKVDDPVWNKAENATVATYTQTTAAGYSLDSTSKNIVYSSDPTTVTLATVSGLNKESVVNEDKDAVGIQTDSTKPDTFTTGLEVTTDATSSVAGVITISGNVLNNGKVTLGRSDNYKFVLDDDDDTGVPTEDVDETQVWAQNRATAIYKNVKPAYYGLDPTEKIVNYTPQADANVEGTSSPNIVTISGLKSGITINADGKVVNADGTTANGLNFETDDSVTVYSAVLGTTAINVDNTTVLNLGEDVMKKTGNYANQTEWVDAGRGSYTFKTYDKAYYELKTAVSGNNDIKYSVNYTPATAGTAYATISGLPTGLTNGDIDFDEADNTDYSKGGVLTLNATLLGTGTVKITNSANATGDFTLALDTKADSENKVTESTIKENSEEWTTKTTTATLTGLKTEGYTLSEDKKTITYQAGDKTVTLATVKGIKSGAEITTRNVTDETVDSEATGNKIITLSASQLGTSNVTVTGDGYKLALASDAVSQTDDAAWVKAANATKATFTQTTYRGFRESTDGKSLIYQKNTGNVDLATINGLSKTLTADQMAIVYKDEKGDVLSESVAEAAVKSAFDDDGALVVIDDVNKVIYLAKDALNASAVTLGNADNYKLKLYGATDGAIGGEEAENDIVYDKSTGTMSIVSGNGAIWKETSDGKSLTFTKDNYTTAATITGLPKDLEFDETDDDPLEGITVAADGTITIGEAAVLSGTDSRIANNGNIVLTNYKVGDDYSTYTLEVDSKLNAKDAKPTSGDKKQWVATTKNLSLKEVTSAYYLKSENTTKHTETITYVAEKVGGDLAVITGLPTGITVGETDGKVYLSDGTTEVIEATSMDDMAVKTVKLKSTFFNDKKTHDADKALTITIAANRVAANQYKFVEATDTDFKGAEPPASNGYGFNYETTPTKGTATYYNKKKAGWTRVSDTQITYTTAYGDILTTINGLNKTTNYSSNSNALQVADGTHEVTVKADALASNNVTITMPKGATEPYKFVLGSDVKSTANAATWQGITNWAVAGGTATYKTYDEAYYKLQDPAKTGQPNSIIYVAPSKGTAYASITGLNKTITSVNQAASENDAGELIITLGANELEGTTKVVLANGGAKTVSAGRNMTEAEATALNTKIMAGNTTSAKFKLALDTDGDNSVTESGIANAVWDNNGKVATLTGTITKGYRLSNDQKSVTYQSADSRLQTIAKVTGIKTGSQISDSNVAALASGATGYNENLPNLQYITLKEEHLSTDNVVLTGEGYKLALDNGVIEATETDKWQNQTEWVNNNGTFVYKTYNKGYYTLDDTTGMRVTYTKPVDDLKTAGTQHKTYLTIAGLSRTADATVLGAAGTVAESSGTITVTTKGSGVIALSDAALNKQNVKLTDNLNGGYSLALGENVTKSTVSNDSAVISGTKATWTGTQGKGYLLANDEQNITYYSAAKAKQTIATVTGLASTVTSANNDAFSNKYKTATNTVELAAADLGNNVVIGGTAAFKFDGYTEGTVTGSAAADKLTFTAGKNTINAAGGNDIITVAGGENTFLYANGNGNDVITGFTAATDGGDILRVTNVVGTTVKTTTNKTTGESTTTYTNNIEVYQDDKIVADTIVRVNKNYIRLKGVQADNVTVEDKNGDKWHADWTHDNTPNGSFVETSAEGDNVFADDNYAMTPNLSSIVKSSTASYTADDLVDDDATSLTKQSTAVSYSDKK